VAPIYKIVVNLKEVGKERTFMQAFTVFYNSIIDKNPNEMSVQILETACWIKEKKLPAIGFCTACGMARQIGLLSEDGHLIPFART
jgi:hypothetical protein